LGEARNNVPKIVFGKLSVLADCSRQKALAERAKRDEPDAEFFQRGKDFCFGLSPPERVFALERGDRLNLVRAANGLHTGLGESEVFYFALLNKILYGSGHVLNGYFGIDPVLIKEIDDIGLKALERSLSDFPDVRGPAIEPGLLACSWVNLESELRGDHYFVAERSQGFANQFFVCVGAIDFSSVKESDTAFDCRADQRNAMLLVHGGAVAKTQAHTAEAEGRNFQGAFS